MFLNPVMNFCISCDNSCALGSLIFRKKICIAPFILDGGGTCAPATACMLFFLEIVAGIVVPTFPPKGMEKKTNRNAQQEEAESPGATLIYANRRPRSIRTIEGQL